MARTSVVMITDGAALDFTGFRLKQMGIMAFQMECILFRFI